MEQRLHEAAIKGNVTLLPQTLREDPLVLDGVNFGGFGWSPLHVAAWRGDAEFVREVLGRNPDLIDILDSSQRSPLHLASLKGHVEVVKELISVDPYMCLTRDKDGKNPLHLAVMKGKVDVLKLLVEANSQAAEVVMDQGETILHLCMMRNQLHCLKELMNTIQNKEIVNAKDERGNTILHLAVANKQIEALDYLLTNAKLDVNIKNASKYTALDILEQIRKDVENSNDIKNKLQSAGAMSGEDVEQSEWYAEWLAKKSGAISMFLATLIASIVFQGGMSPPGGVWQDNSDGHRAGEAIMAYNYPHSFPYFIRASTVRFVASLSTILLLITGLAFKRRIFMWILIAIMWLTITSTAVTFAISIVVITPRVHSEPISHTINVAIIVWCSLMGILFLVQMACLLKEQIKEQWSRQYAKRIEKINALKSHQPI